MPSNATRDLISLSRYVSFGRALIRRVGVSTQAVAQRLEAGESAEEVMQDYGLRSEELHEAVLYEAAA